MKKIFFYLLLLHGATIIAQINNPPAYYYNGTTSSNWFYKALPGPGSNSFFTSPVSWSTASGGTFIPVIDNNNYPQNCQVSGQFPNPYNIISPDPAPCNYPTGTVFYKTDFVLPFGPPFCNAVMRVRADNTFRLYINGQNVVGDLIGCTGSYPNNVGLIGNTFFSIFTIDIANFLVAGANTIVIEVQNCPGPNPNPSYVSADIRVDRNLVGVQDANFSIFVGPVNGNSVPVTFTGTNANQRRGPSNVSWKIEQSDFENGPWSTILIQNPSLPVLTTNLPVCKWFRVTRTVTNECSTVSYTRKFKTCEEFGGSGVVSRNVSEEFMTDLVEAATQFAEDEKAEYVYQTFGPEVDQVFINDPEGQVIDTDPKLATFNDANEAHNFEVSPNPAVDYLQINHDSYTNARLEIIDLLGKVLDTWEVDRESSQTTLDLHKISVSGIYFVRLVDQASGAILHSEKVQILRN